LWNRTCWILR